MIILVIATFRPVTPFMSYRLKPFSTDELSALLFSLDVAGTVDPLTPEAQAIHQEMVDALKERCHDTR